MRLFSHFLSLSLRIVAYTEKVDNAEERRGGATQRSLNPGKEGPREEERRGEAASPRHVARARSKRQRRGSAEKTAPSSKKTTVHGPEGGSQPGQGLQQLTAQLQLQVK